MNPDPITEAGCYASTAPVSEATDEEVAHTILGHSLERPVVQFDIDSFSEATDEEIAERFE